VHVRGPVAVGGALGSVGRVALAEVWPAASSWVVWADLAVNVSGAFLLAVLVARVDDPRWRAGLGTGLLGSWTTVSALGVGVGVRLVDGDVVPGLVYALATMALGLLAVGLGTRLAGRAEVAA
jgi:CrcB protein